MKIKHILFILCFFVASFVCIGCASTGIEDIDSYECYNVGSGVPEELKGYQKVLVYATCNLYDTFLGNYFVVGHKDTQVLCTIYNNRFTRLQVWNTKVNSSRSSYYDWSSGKVITTNTVGNSYKELDDLIGPMSYKYIIEVYN